MLQGANYRLHLIAGRAFGLESAVKVYSPTAYIDAEMEAGASFDFNPEYQEQAVYVVNGQIAIGGEILEAGTMGVLKTEMPANIVAQLKSRLILLGGAPIDGPQRTIWWNFVASNPELIETAKRNWREQRFDTIPGDNESIPLPDK